MVYSYDYGTTSYDSGAGDAMAGLLAGGVGIGMLIVWFIVVFVMRQLEYTLHIAW
jgi:hypothetical protein